MSNRPSEQEPQHYLSFLLRLWQIKRSAKWVWQASLQRVGTDERTGFATMEKLLDHLRRLTEARMDHKDPPAQESQSEGGDAIT